MIAAKAATGLTGFVAKHLGVTPIVAAGIKYLTMGGIIFGSYHIWKANVKEDIVTDIVIEAQDGAIKQQQQSAEDNAEDADSKTSHEASTAERELEDAKKFLRQQSAKLEALEEENEKLKNYADNKPCLREHWPDSLQRRGGFNLNQGSQDQGPNPNADRSLNKD